jgi:hypothetical protein
VNEIAKAADPLREAVKWIVAGNSEPDVLDAIAATFPDAKARPLIVRAIEYIAKQGKPDVQLVRGFAIEGTREIYRKCLEVGDHQTALRALKQLMELAEKN